MKSRAKWFAQARQKVVTPAEGPAFRQYLISYQQSEKGCRAKGRSIDVFPPDWTLEQIRGKSLRVIGENGVGDEVLTISCLRDLSETCKSVTWSCGAKLLSLFCRSFPAVEFISRDAPRPMVDGSVYSWSLIGRFRRQLSDFHWSASNEAFVPYLRPLDVRKDALAKRYRCHGKKVVGLTWRSERDGRVEVNKTCGLRDVPHWLHLFQRLREKTCFVSLQYGDTRGDIEYIKQTTGVQILQDENVDIFNDFESATAQVAAMDYVVSISTTTAHLAGAIGVPGWVLLQHRPYPHWRAGVHVCPWYPTLRPIRQDSSGNWGTVLETLEREMEDEIG